ncbi:hypothetical protein MTR67_027206 [Solanum verrucosum]|uniref:DUF4218 domain-containing protein n=1 Tax=Solanum verrucosum TaxID=315347 RepID=A0AAF0R8Q6_SOLVR|nr:hypothetical protein MTR67_027206 [Solanum verrucosum]
MLKEELLPDEADLPNTYYGAKKVIQNLGLSYERIDACRNDCMLYWKDDKLPDSCKVCGESKWKVDKHNGKAKDKKAEPRNVRLGLASDGFQPFRNAKTSYSIWPVVLIPYNLPPWLCMKQENFIMSMLIPCPDGPGDAIDIYLQPLIEELKELWDIGAKLLRIDDLEQVEAQIPITLCTLEKVFPLSFFDVMVHLPIHLANEAMLGGPVQYRWIEFAQIHVDSTQHLSDDESNRQFIEWFQDKVAQLHKEDDSRIMEDLLALSRGPTKYVLHYNGYIVNGYRFHAEDYDKSLRTQRFDMKPSKYENEVASRVKATTKYAYAAPGAIGKGRGRGLKSMLSLGVSRTDISFSPSTDQVMQYNQFTETSAQGKSQGLKSMCSIEDFEIEERSFNQNARYVNQSFSQGLRTMNKKFLTFEKEHMQTDVAASLSTDNVMESTPTFETSFSQGLRTMNKKFLTFEKEHMQTDVAASLSTDNVMESTPTFETSFFQGWRTTNKTALAHEKESLNSDISISHIDQVKLSAHTAETSSCATGMDKKVQGSNKCNEVASLDIGQKLKVIFYNNRTVGKNSNLFSRQLGNIVCDRNICPLGVSSWKHIKEEKDKFDSDDTNSRRDHILGWMKELWNKWRGQLHANYVKGKPIQEALKNMPKRVEKKQ